jgi:hypothetical protein
LHPLRSGDIEHVCALRPLRMPGGRNMILETG